MRTVCSSVLKNKSDSVCAQGLLLSSLCLHWFGHWTCRRATAPIKRGDQIQVYGKRSGGGGLWLTWESLIIKDLEQFGLSPNLVHNRMQ
uniref:Uncharacterized protein n=1 Tax=Rhizophora mucronata TaxID=61149 RepID=A0A2P2NNG5_RHIMU